MTSRGIDRLRMTRGRPVAPAIVRRAKMGTTFDHFARNLDFGVAWIVALLRTRASRIDRHAAGMLLLVARDIKVGRPLPDIADHVVEAMAVRRIGADR